MKQSIWKVTVHLKYKTDHGDWLTGSRSVTVSGNDDVSVRAKAIKKVVADNGGSSVTRPQYCEIALLATAEL